ncbi:unnamed protein product, partial [marine sediment metagenome]
WSTINWRATGFTKEPDVTANPNRIPYRPNNSFRVNSCCWTLVDVGK